MRVKAQASSSARGKTVFYTPPACNLLGRIRVVFSGFRGQRKRASDRWNTVVNLIDSVPKGAAERPAVQRAAVIAFAKYWATLYSSGRKERTAMLDRLTPEATELTLGMLLELDYAEDMPDVTHALILRYNMWQRSGEQHQQDMETSRLL